MAEKHIQIEELPYCGPVKKWLSERYGEPQARKIWEKVRATYDSWLPELPDYGGRKNGHARAIYGGLLIFALYPALPDSPPIAELQDFVQRLFMGPFTKLGRVFDLNRAGDMRVIDIVFRRSGDRDRRDIKKYPAGFVNSGGPYDRQNRAASYRFTQCPNADFARSHGLMHVLPLLCNSDYFGISEIHGQLIRRGTCGNGDSCDYLVVGDKNPLAERYETVTDEGGFLVSRPRDTPDGRGDR